MNSFNDAPKSGIVVQKNVFFVQDYSKEIADFCKNFVNSIAVFISSANFAGSSQEIAQSEYFFNNYAVFLPVTAKKVCFLNSFSMLTGENARTLQLFLFCFVILSFILRYIGLLRLFNGGVFFMKQIKF